jgi:hypothetical protein
MFISEESDQCTKFIRAEKRRRAGMDFNDV